MTHTMWLRLLVFCVLSCALCSYATDVIPLSRLDVKITCLMLGVLSAMMILVCVVGLAFSF